MHQYYLKEDAVMPLVSKGLKESFSTRDREQIDFQYPLLPREKITRFSFVARRAKSVLEFSKRYHEQIVARYIIHSI